jgi:drug/metabolite transporter (DMT)-like permease
MSTLTHDTASGATPGGADAAASRLTAGLLFALVSAVSFGMSGALARGLIETDWSAGAMTLVRVGLAAVALTPFGVAALRGRWGLLRRNAGLLLAYGAIAVAGAQFCYFSAIQHMQVGPAILIEFTAPAAVVAYLWLRHGQRPGRMTLAGAGLAALGLVLVLDLVSGADLSLPGVLWALAAMIGCATYFIISADEDNGLPPLVLAWSGLVVGALVLALLGLIGVLPMRASTASPSYADVQVAWWVPLVVLGLVTAALAYVAGIAAGRRLGSRLASFVALLEVVASVLWAWLLLNELPAAAQLFGGLLILAGVVAVKLGERSVVVRPPSPA